MALEDLLRWLEAHESPLAYVVLGLASLVEYLFPPFPGDTVAIFGVFLATSAGYRPLLVYLALEVGAVAGGMGAYAFGRAFAEAERRPRWLRGPRAERALDVLVDRYARYGAVYLVLNRFVPALRAFFFVGAGLARMPAVSVALWGAVSAAVWNALLLAGGWVVGRNWELLVDVVRGYSAAAMGVVLVVAVALGVRAWRRCGR